MVECGYAEYFKSRVPDSSRVGSVHSVTMTVDGD